MDEFKEQVMPEEPVDKNNRSRDLFAPIETRGRPKPKELEEATLPIGQRQWAVTCAEDPFYILETARLGSCFATIIYETEKKMGTMIHVDQESDFGEVFGKMIILLDENGGEKYRVILVNCDFTEVSTTKRGEALKQAVEQEQEEMSKMGKLAGAFKFKKSQSAASFNLKTGDFCPFDISQKTIEAQIARQIQLHTADVKPETLGYQLIYISNKLEKKF